jgi:phenylalanine-4-hydroxylase
MRLAFGDLDMLHSVATLTPILKRVVARSAMPSKKKIMMAPMRLPTAPAANAVQLRGDYSAANADYVVEQAWGDYTPLEHSLWARLLKRQFRLIERYGAPQVLAGLKALHIADHVPRFDQASQVLRAATGWEIVAVPGLIPEQNFFAHLAKRHFPVTVWLRTPEEIDYLSEPDVFHDFFGHVPLLCDPVFADFMQAYGEAGRKANAEGGLTMLARLYWYCVEFGLIKTDAGLRAYGAGILSSAGETVFCIDDPSPNRIGFDLERVMRTDYMIDSYQKTYFVMDSFEQLFRSSYDRDFAPIYRAYRDSPGLKPELILPTDTVVTRGTVGAPGVAS